MINEMILKRNSEALITVEEATKILNGFGLSNTDKKTREYVNSGVLKAVPMGSSLRDKRSGYKIQMSHLMTFILNELPSVRVLYKRIEELEEGENKDKKTRQKKELAANVDDVNQAKINDIL